MRSSNNHPKLVGLSNLAKVVIEGIAVPFLFDIEVNILMISDEFCKDYLSYLEIQPMETILKIECADGQLLPFNLLRSYYN